MRVGTSRVLYSGFLVFWDHPHACGDKFHNLKFDGSFLGSSPCVWGQAQLRGAGEREFRIIPMRVGTRNGNVIPAFTDWDHPHACGDKFTW